MDKSEHHNWTEEEYYQKTGKSAPVKDMGRSSMSIINYPEIEDADIVIHTTYLKKGVKHTPAQRQESNWGDAACGSGNN